MTKKQSTASVKFKSIIAFILLFLLSFTLFFISACGETTAEEDTVYKKVENDDSSITNGSFEFGTADIAISDLPQTASLTGWGGVSTENGSTSSSVPSGIINTSSDAYKALVDKLYNNNTYKSKISTIYPDIDTATLTEDEVKEKLVEKNPGVHSGANSGESKIYMLNAYTTDIWKTAETTTSASTITLKNGEFGKISFWVYVPYVSGGEYKVNFRLNNSFNSNTQAQYVLSGIGSDSWTNYTIYLKGDENFSTTFTVVLSIGYSPASRTSQNYSEGTAYFDDLVFETIEESDLPSINPDYTKNLEYGSEKYSIKQIASDGVFEYLYDMTLNTPSGYFNPVNNLSSTTVTQKYTGNRETSLDKFPADSSFGTLSFPDSSSIALTDITFASVSLTIQDSANFVLAPESYMIITFDITNGLSTSGSTLITVLVYDEELTETSAFTTSDTEEVVHGGITIINNDPDNEKSFYLVIVIGPTDVSATSSKYSFASGNVEINNVSAAVGLTYQYVRDNDPTSPTYGETIYPTEETENRKYYDLLSSTYQNVNIDEYSKDAEDTYYLAASKTYGDNGTSNLTTIRIAPVAAENYRGVSYNSNYVKADGTDNAINARTGKSGDGNGNYAGLINSRFDYSTLTDSINVNDNLNYSGEKSIQPLMIYNSTADSYGFIGKSFSIVANANATISVKVKAVGNAKAYVYLVDTADKDKSVFTMDFTGNVKNNSYGEKFTAQLAFTGITESSMDANGWKTLTFYIANGATALDLRLELWNGSRDGEEKSEGFVFFAFDAFGNDETFTPSTLSSAFTEPTSAVSAFATSGNPLYDNAINNGDTTLRDNALQYKRELDATEIKYNSENPDNAVSYDPNYVWAKSDNVIYSVFNTIDPVAIDPYDNTDEDTGSGCTAQTDPSTFWLSFSSILLAAVLVLAIIMLVVKNVRRRRKANKSDAKSHYNVTSRNKSKKKDQKVKKATKQPEYVGYEDEPSKEEQVKDDVREEVQEQTENNEEYVYGDVQDFGSDVSNDENKNNEQ